jgi:transposase-like protein
LLSESRDLTSARRFFQKALAAPGAQRTIQGYEAMHMIRNGQVRWLSKSDIAAQVRFIKVIFGLAA